MSKPPRQQEVRGLTNSFTQTSLLNQLDYIIERKIRQMVNTAAIVSVDQCNAPGPGGPAGVVSATPMVCQTDAQGRAIDMPSIPRMRFFRQQAGVAALIIDPVPGDKGVAVFCKSDSSRVKPGVSGQQVPASFRSYDLADGVYLGGTDNQPPKVYIEIKQDETVVIHAPRGVRVETGDSGEIVLDSPITRVTGNLTATGARGRNVSIGNARRPVALKLYGHMDSTGDITAEGVSVATHTHGGVQRGGSSTDVPD